MKVLVKILDRSLLRRYGLRAEVHPNIASTWEKEGKCIALEVAKPERNSVKLQDRMHDKMVWTPPEEKVFSDESKGRSYFPTEDSSLFLDNIIG